MLLCDCHVVSRNGLGLTGRRIRRARKTRDAADRDGADEAEMQADFCSIILREADGNELHMHILRVLRSILCACATLERHGHRSSTNSYRFSF